MKSNHQGPQHKRVNYEDHSHKFLDWAKHLGLEKTFFARWFFAINQKINVQKLLLIFCFSVILAIAITFEIHSSVNFQIGEVVKYDFSSPYSFEMVDDITTEEKRLKAEMAVPIILDYDPSVFERSSGAIYRSFRLMRAEFKATHWAHSASAYEEQVKDFFIHKGQFEKELGEQIPDYLFEWLVRNHFSARLENIVIHNLEIWYQSQLIENVDKAIPSHQTVVLARTVAKNNKGKEFSVKRDSVLDVANKESFILKYKSGLERSSEKDIQYLLDFSRYLIYPNFTLNKQEMATRRQGARDSILPITISIRKNQTILPEGTLMQPYHLSLLKHIDLMRSDRRQEVLVLAISFLFLSIIIVFFQYVRRFSLNKVKVENHDLLVMGFISLITIIVAKGFLFLTETAFLSRFGSMWPPQFFLYAMPVAAAPMMVGLLIQSGEVVWLFTTFLSVAVGLMTEMNFAYMVVTFASGIAAARGVYGCKKRNDIYWAGVRTGLVNALMIGLLLVVTMPDNQDLMRIIAYCVPAGFLSGIFSSMVAMMLVPFIESAFNYTTDIKLLELSNLNHPLLKEMIVKAPGTYHHSMLVGSMVEAAAEEIGANPLLAKVMSYYHDIGKIAHANYFIENQKPGSNPHDHISAYMSKTLLIAHVKDGVELGMAYKLGKPIIDGIIQHHGTTLISYFYNKAMDGKDQETCDISEEDFRYPGPKPQFREAALCMLADSIEAAGRSLDEPTPVRLQNIVRNIIQRKFMEGQLDECSLTLKDLSRVEAAFTKILLGIYHQRIDYPRAAGGGASEAPQITPFFSRPS